MRYGIKKAIIIALCWLCVVSMTAFLGVRHAWAGDVPALGSMVSPLGQQDPWQLSLPGAQGSQLGLYYFRQHNFSNSLFTELKFSPTSLTSYSKGKLEKGTATKTSQIGITVGNAQGVSSQWVYVSGSKNQIQTTSIPIPEGDTVTLRYPTFDSLHSFISSSPAFNCNPNTFNSGITHTLISYNGGKVIKSESGINQNYFVSEYGTIDEAGYEDEAVKFANGGQIDFNPSSNTVDIQGGSGPTSSSVKVTSATTGKTLENLTLNQSAYNIPFGAASRVDISATPSNPIVSAENTFSGSPISTSTLTQDGWDLSGNNTVINRYSQVQLYWQPSSQDLPVYRYMLYKYLGNSDFTTFRDTHPAFFNWLISNPIALNQFLTSGYASTYTIGGMGAYTWNNSLNSASELDALNVWYHIWSKYPGSRGGEDLKIAVAVALDFAHNVIAWQPGTPINPLGRYEIYATAFANNTLIGTFGDYSAQMLRDVVDDRISNAGMQWLRYYIMGHNSLYMDPPDLSHGYWLIDYTYYTPYGSTFHAGLYGPRSTIWNMMRYGGTCGKMSKTSQFILNSFGMPGLAIGQPHHCAYMFFYTNSKWELGYNYAGWSITGSLTDGHHTRIPWIFNGTQLNTNQYDKNSSYLETFQAELDEEEGNWSGALSEVKDAVATAPNNVCAWKSYINIANHMNLTSDLKEQIQNNFETLAKAANQAYGGGFTYYTIISTLSAEVK